jgi:NADPH-dependent 2,4-dienoyl-CoA reductase/sulfur reductase-like enzyme
VCGERGHRVTVLEAMPWAGGQMQLVTRNPRRRDLNGIVEWRLAEAARLGVEIRYDTVADADLVASLSPDVVIVATGGIAKNPEVVSGAEHMVSAWEIVGGDVKPQGEVVFYDDDSGHSAMTTAELIVNAGCSLEIVTPERGIGVDVGGLNLVPYLRALNEADARITLNRRVRSITRRPDGRLDVIVGSDHSPVTHVRTVDMVVGDHGVTPNDDLYHQLVPGSANLGELDHDAFVEGRPQTVATNPAGSYRLFRIGDAVEGRNIHAAVYDALRLCAPL